VALYEGPIDIVIPVWRESQTTVDCIKAVIRSTSQPFTLIVPSSQGSCARNLNMGIRMAKAPVMVLMDDDVMVESDSIRRLATTLLNLSMTKQAGAVAPRVLGAVGLPLTNATSLLNEGSGINQIRTHQISGCCVAVLTSAGQMMDERFEGSQWNDTDFFRSLEERGFTFWVDASVSVNHVAMARRAMNNCYEENRRKYHEKWPAPSCGCC
jgi:GT2 family glycosyltransferase